MDPVWSQFEVNPENGPTLPALEGDATTRLSHRPGVDTPVIEETWVALDRATASSEATYLTETKESADPDLVRMSASGNATFTKITRGGEDPQDPDILRADRKSVV